MSDIQKKLDHYLNEQSDEKKEQMYREGTWQIRSAFNEFSQHYMRGMGMMQQGKSVKSPQYKKLRDAIANAYERMDDAITKHADILTKDMDDQYKDKMKKVRR